MLKKVNDLFCGLPMTLIGGIFLAISFILPKFGIIYPINPAWVTIIISGIPLFYLAVQRTIHNKGIGKISSAHLICIAMIAAIIIGDLFAAGEVAFIMAIGEKLEDMTVDRAKKGLKKISSLAPTHGRRITDGKETMIAAEEILKNDILRILPGETIPADGIIICGETSVDQSAITGEYLPVDKTVGDDVFSGTVNRFGAIDIRVNKDGYDSSLQRLIRMVREAEGKKAPTARIADKAASLLVPSALIIAICTWIATGNIVRAVTVLVVFCPCALVLATPTAIMAAIGQAAKHGIIIKSGEALEKLGKLDIIAFDKTGTLTYGKLQVCDIVSFAESINAERLLMLASSAETKSEHPIGKAIVAYAKNLGIEPSETDSFEMKSGKGIYAKISNKEILCGNEKYLTENGVHIADTVRRKTEKMRLCGKAVVLVSENGFCIGAIALSDAIRRETKKMIAELVNLKTDTFLLTGDNKLTADYFASQIGISDVFSELLPDEKANVIAELASNGKTVCMIGDGINDAPALKTADVGISMSDVGSDIATEASDIALFGDDISKIPYLMRLSKATVKTIKAGITLSMCINIVSVALSVVGVLNPTTGALVHNAGSCFVVLTAALLYDRKFE